MSGGETAIYSDGASSTGETNSLYQLQDGRLTITFRSFRKFTSVEATHKGMLHDGLSSGGFRMLSRLDEVGAAVQLRARLTNPANEDVNSAKGDSVAVLN